MLAETVMKSHRKLGNGIIAILLGCAAVIILTATAPSIGIVVDEDNYIAASDSYASWFSVVIKDPVRAFQPETIDEFWNPLHEHPPVAKTWMGLVWLGTRSFFDTLTANRIGPILLVGGLVSLLYLLVSEKYGRGAGLFAAAALISMPRFFFHAHLVTLDVPVAVAIFGVTFLFWKTIDRKGWGWGILLGVAWGLAEGVKLNATFIPISLLAWVLIFRRKRYVILRFILMGITAMLTFFLSWPWIYHNTWSRLADYVNFHLHHYPIGTYYLGQYYLPPPWHYSLVVLWAVVPLTLMLLFGLGLISAGKGKKDGGLAWLLILSALVSILPFLLGIPAYDMERLFMPIFPFLAALAGIGFSRLLIWLDSLAERLRRPVLVAPLSILLGIAFLAPQSVAMARLYPHLSSYYSEGVGGLRGATKLGLETTNMSEILGSSLPFLNSNAAPGDIIWAEDCDVFHYYQHLGRLRSDLECLNNLERNADWLVYDFHQSQFEKWKAENYPLWQQLQGQKSVYEVNFDGIPLMKIYRAVK
jgi:4-amino-4-deoxy-L-arabinose transferase-like glycosyltransferase